MNTAQPSISTEMLAIPTGLTLTQYESYRRFVLELSEKGKHDQRRLTERYWGRTDLFYLLRYLLHRPDVHHPWLLSRCQEVQANPNEQLDLWAREHYKSTIITFALTIQDILSSHGDEPLPKWNGTEVTFGIFSHTRPIAKKFLRQIKNEFETNGELVSLYPDVLWGNPSLDAPGWSLDDGIIVRRRSNPKESTVEAWGLVDSQPTSAHFYGRVYDDVVTRKSVHTPESNKLTTDSWRLSLNLASRGGFSRTIGTRYANNDTYHVMMKAEAATARIYPATIDGKVGGTPVLMTAEALAKKRRRMGSFIFAAQMMQNPTADDQQGFNKDDMRYYYTRSRQGLNVYIIVDPAHEKKRDSDYTALVVIGLGSDRNYYLLDMVRDRLNLRERTKLVMDKHREWKPITVGWEKYGKDADIEYIYEVQDRENYRFQVVALGGPLGNIDRVRRLIPTHEEHRWYYPETLAYTDYEKNKQDLMQIFKDEELIPFPVGMHADIMDAQSRILDEDMKVVFPKEGAVPALHGGTVVPFRKSYKRRSGARPEPTATNTSWMA